MENNWLGDRIKEVRIKRGLTQVALAKELGLNPQTIRDYETGRISPTVKGLPALAKALDLKVSQLIEGADELPPVRELPVSQLLKKLSSIPDGIYELASELNNPKDDIWKNIAEDLAITISERQIVND